MKIRIPKPPKLPKAPKPFVSVGGYISKKGKYVAPHTRSGRRMGMSVILGKKR